MRSGAWLTTAALILAVAPAAGAAPRAVCKHQILDPAGDANTSGNPSLGSDDVDRLDLVASDIATNRSRVTVAFTVKSLAFEGSTLNENQYQARFAGARASFLLIGYVRPEGTDAYLYTSASREDAGLSSSLSSAVGRGSVTVDVRKHRVLVTVDRAVVDLYGGFGRTIATPAASTFRGVSVAGVFATTQVDQTEGSATYVTDSASACVA